ncbi:KDM1B [Branchiostoma lanceolatum]|uniref:KDM1B protein n=1 Tax=Branchiostoma lanceolatum TaxID=7740 RepID=A0A8J9ZZ95_BRALA|nr:KDM1B [Branchiostoma lanceolatum]
MFSFWSRMALSLLITIPVCKGETVKTKVLVLGAGMAGISAARSLNQSGLTDFVILEGTGRIGGRVWSVQFGGKTIDIGGNWVHGLSDDNPVWVMVKSYNMTGIVSNWDNIKVRNSSGHDVTSQWHTVLVSLDEPSEAAYDLAVERNATGQPDMPLRAALKSCGWNPTSSMEKAVEYASYDWGYGEEPDVTSLLRGELDPTPELYGESEYLITDQRGYVYIIKQMAESFLAEDDQRLKLNKTITTIQWSDDGVTVTTKDGSRYTADFAIVTFSMGVLQSNSVEFVPGLPNWKREVIFRVRMSLYTTIYMKFPSKFWDDDEYIVYVGERRGYFTVWQNMEAEGLFPAGTNILQVTLTAEEARRVEAQSDQATQAEIMAVLRTMYGAGIPDPTDILVPRWGQDPFFRGSFANWGVGIDDEGLRKLQAPVAGRLFFAGEATDLAYGFIHSAFFEGARVAGAIATCVGGGPCEEGYQPPRRGCTCPAADNFDIQATVDNGSCLYPTSGGDRIVPFSTSFYIMVVTAFIWNDMKWH